MSRQIKSEGKHWRWTGHIILNLQENLEPTLSTILSTEWRPLHLTTLLGVDRDGAHWLVYKYYFAFTKGFIQTVCLPVLPYSATTAHFYTAAWIDAFIVVLFTPAQVHTHGHIWRYKHRQPSVWKKCTQACKHLTIKALDKGTTVGTCASPQMCNNKTKLQLTKQSQYTHPSLFIHM